jgi:fimbrial chaperone protein
MEHSLSLHHAVNPLFRAILKVGIALIFFSPTPVLSGQFSVSPITLVFEEGVRSGIINVMNEEDKKLHVQIKAFEWTQDENGQDRYVETDDILFFPRIMILDKNEQRIVRAGIKNPTTAREKTYRLFIEEIPDPKRAEVGTQIQVAIRFGVPIFVKPPKEQVEGKIEKMILEEGELKVAVRNKGNAHFVIQSILIRGVDRKGAETFSKEMSGWYLLNGVMRSYATAIPREICREMSKLDVEVKTTSFSLHEKLDADQIQCLP